MQGTDQQQTAIAEAIVEFDWHNYSLDEVEEVETDDEQAFPDYAWDLAENIVRKLGLK